LFKPELLDCFKGKKILVLGDFMIDEYIEGVVERISPEAPVPVVEAKDITVRPGGAANVVANLLTLGAQVTAAGVVGNDQPGKELKELLKNYGASTELLLTDSSRPTTRKTRIVASSQQLLRVDWESKEEVNREIERELLSFLLDSYKMYDAVIVSDYGKGVVTPQLFKYTAEIRKYTPVLVDPKEKNFPIYREVTTMTPNVKETYQAVGLKPEDDEKAERAGKKLIEKFSLEFAVITRSEKGISVVTKEEARHIPTRAKQVFDVTGAGDTVISAFTLAMVSGADPFTAAEVANIAAGIVVGKLGTATVTLEELKEAAKSALQNL
jgi:rfaE bifunctional protein kinase chain/domain